MPWRRSDSPLFEQSVNRLFASKTKTCTDTIESQVGHRIKEEALTAALIKHLHTILKHETMCTRRPASADRTARRQFQATGQPVSRTQASDAMTSRLLRYEAKCVQRTRFQWGLVPLRADIKGTELSSANILIPLER